MKVFVDSDVVISSLLSSTGAAFLLLNQPINVEFFISNISVSELGKVAERLEINPKTLKLLIEERFSITELTSIKTARATFADYVLDKDDAHIVAGAKEGKVRFLITYNIKDFKHEPIKKDFAIIVLTPGQFLQYFRSLR